MQATNFYIFKHTSQKKNECFISKIMFLEYHHSKLFHFKSTFKLIYDFYI